MDEFKKIEWIDDTSANIVYHTSDAAFEALLAFSESTSESTAPSDIRRAKQMSSHPNADLQIRQAFAGDVKAPRAREKSRFYLMNPEQDPGERRYDDRYDRRMNGRGRGRRENGNGGRGRTPESKPFDVNMYDDDAGESTNEPRSRARRESYSSFSSGHSQGRKQVNFNSNARSSGRLRDRSASPARGQDGRYGFDEDQPARKTARRRSYTPPNNSTKELFPAKVSGSAFDTPLTNGNAGVELFPNHSASQSKRNRELFPHKTAHSNHRRSDALNAEETAYLMSPGSLASRITGGPKKERDSDLDQGFSFKGRAESRNNGSSDFSILGASRGVNAKVKELFPDRLPNNSGKELFADRMRARAPRRRADDLL